MHKAKANREKQRSEGKRTVSHAFDECLSKTAEQLSEAAGPFACVGRMEIAAQVECEHIRETDRQRREAEKVTNTRKRKQEW